MTVAASSTDSQAGVSIQLGAAERWIVSISSTLLLSMLGFIAVTFAHRLDTQADQLAEVAKQQAVANAQLSSLSVQMADVPGMKQQLGELQVRVERNTNDIQVLRTGRHP